MSKLTRDQLLSLHRGMTEDALKLMTAKNSDYGATSDALYNFRADGLKGIIVRLHDKIARLRTAAKRQLEVKDETAYDTVLDIINYSVLYWAYMVDRAYMADRAYMVDRNRRKKSG